MKNLSKGSTVVILLVVIIVVLLGVVGYLYFKPLKSEKLQNSQTIDINQELDSDFKTLENSDFSISYSNKIFSQGLFSTTLPPKYDSNYSGVKFISVNRAQMIGKNQCSYGESAFISICTLEKEGGISFIVVNNSIQNLTLGLEASLKTNVIIAGKQSIVWNIGAEGEGMDYYYVPISPNKTLVIERLYRYDGFPTNIQFNQMISTLKLN